jgi:hypothetical protein
MDDVPVIDNVAARLAFIRVRVDRRLPTIGCLIEVLQRCEG